MKEWSWEYAGETFRLAAEPVERGWRIEFPGGSAATLSEIQRQDGRVETRMDDRLLSLAVAVQPDGLALVSWQGQVYEFNPQRKGRRARAAEESGTLRAPMAGVVTRVLVAEGESVAAYQPLVVLEAMKVLATLEAPFDGVVSRLEVRKGDRVAHGAPVVTVQPSPNTRTPEHPNTRTPEHLNT